MAKFNLNRVVKDLNSLVKRHKTMLLFALGVIVMVALSKNMFSKRCQVRREGFSQEKKIVYFYMENCGYCKKFNPEWERFVQGNSMKSEKINANSGNPLIKKMGVSGYPTVMIIEGGKKLETFDGERTADGLEKFVNENQN